MEIGSDFLPKGPSIGSLEGIPFAIDVKRGDKSQGELELKELKEHHDRGSRNNMMIGGEVWVLPSMKKGEIVGQIGSCH
jgi:hypothetical protein